MDAPAIERASPTLRTLLLLAWPIVISRSAQVVVGLSDAFLVAHLGENALAATTTGALNAFNLFILPMGTVFIVSSFSSQHFGKGDLAGARRYGWYGIITAGFAQLLTFVGLPLIDDGLALLSYSPEVTNLQAKYLQYRLWTGGAVVGLEALANYYGGIGNTRLPMAAQVLAMTLNVALNVLLINGYWGFPAMGVAGSALASALATLVAFLALFACFFFGVGAPKATERAVLKAGELTRMLRFGLPSGFNWFFEFLAFSFFVNFVVAGLGTTAVAALMSVIQLCSVSFMPAFGISSAGAILVGQAIGAGVLDDVPRIAKLTAKTTTVWQGLVSAMFIAMPTLLLRPFLSNDDAANVAFLAVGARMLRLATLWQVSDALATTLAETLRAAGDTAFTMWTRVVAGWLVFAPGSFITVRYFGGTDVAAVLWLAGYMTLLAGAFYLRFRAGAWRRLDLTGLHGGAPI